MTTGEQEQLAMLALMHLANGWWAGVDTDQGGHADVFEDCPERQRPVRAFVEDCYAGQWQLNEGFVFEYANDLAGELRLMRGWCPHRSWADEPPPSRGREDAAKDATGPELPIRWRWLR